MNAIVRKIARSYYWQFLYHRVKEIGSIKLFDNTTEFSMLQILFLQWLETYNVLFSDLASGEEFLSEEIINDDIRCDAYLLYRSKKRKQEQDKQRKKVNVESTVPGVIFTRKRQ